MRDNVANSMEPVHLFLPLPDRQASEGMEGSWPDDQPAGVYSGVLIHGSKLPNIIA
jgi:hypothetical protein